MVYFFVILFPAKKLPLECDLEASSHLPFALRWRHEQPMFGLLLGIFLSLPGIALVTTMTSIRVDRHSFISHNIDPHPPPTPPPFHRRPLGNDGEFLQFRNRIADNDDVTRK